MTSSRPLVIGIGNPMRGDDGVGPAVVAALRGAVLDADVLTSDGETARLLDAWTGRHRVVVVDALRSGAPPGTVVTLDARHDRLPDPPIASSHALGLAHAVELGRRLDRLPHRLLLVGVEGADFTLGAGLSPQVATAVAAAAQRVRAALGATPTEPPG